MKTSVEIINESYEKIAASARTKRNNKRAAMRGKMNSASTGTGTQGMGGVFGPSPMAKGPAFEGVHGLKEDALMALKKHNAKKMAVKAGIAAAGAGAAIGAGVMAKKMYDKKKEEKTAFDIVEESCEKIAASARTKRNNKRATMRSQMRGASAGAQNMGGVFGPSPMAKEPFEGLGGLKQDVTNALKKDRAKRVAAKAGIAAAGTGAAVGAGVMAKKMYDKKKAEKTALDIVNESFEKQAGLASSAAKLGTKAVKTMGKVYNSTVGKTGLGSAVKDYARESRNLKKMKDLAVEGARTGNKSYMDMAGAGINELQKSKDFMGAVVKDEFKKLPKNIAQTAMNNKGATAGIVAGGATVVGAKHALGKRKQDV